MRFQVHFLGTIALVVLVSGCRKVDPIVSAPVSEKKSLPMTSGLPTAIDSVNGALCAMFFSAKLPGNSHSALSMSAVFRDPCGNLFSIFHPHTGPVMSFIGNVYVGDLKFNSYELSADTSGGHSFYWSTNAVKSASVTQDARWQAEGNRSFHKLDINVERGFPAFKDSVITLHKSQMLSLAPELIFTNYDSLFINIYPNNTPGKEYWASAGAGSGIIRFDSAVVNSLNPVDYHSLTAVLVNYSHITIENKRYVFILSQKIQRPVDIQP